MSSLQATSKSVVHAVGVHAIYSLLWSCEANTCPGIDMTHVYHSADVINLVGLPKPIVSVLFAHVIRNKSGQQIVNSCRPRMRSACCVTTVTSAVTSVKVRSQVSAGLAYRMHQPNCQLQTRDANPAKQPTRKQGVIDVWF